MSGPRTASRALLRGVAVLSFVAAGLLAPATAPAALAADDTLSLVSVASYELLPDQGLVHVVVDVTARNNKPNKVEETPNGTLTTRYFYDAAGIVIHHEAATIRATIGKTSVSTKLTPEEGYAVLQVNFIEDLNFRESVSFRVEYDLPGGAPRSDSDIRVGSAFATFYAWAFGDRGDVRIVIPAGFAVESTGSTVTETVTNGITILDASAISDPTTWYTTVVADRHEALTQDRLDLDGGEHLVIRAWPEDTEWRTRVADLLRVGLPVLVGKIGLDWPVEGDIEVAEVHTPLLEGYAGVFYPDEDRIEISEDLDELTIIHEASHAWFNGNLFAGRWIGEGLADEYAARVLDEVSVGGLRPDAVSPSSPGAIDLNAWVHPGRIDDDETNTRETYGYEASWSIVRGLVDEIGEESMRGVLVAANEHRTAYVGASDPETVTIQNDWRRFLDLLEEAGGSTKADATFERYVVTDAQADLLERRRDAREAYGALLDAGDGWLPGYAVRDPMGRWEFGRATEAITSATAILTTRDEIAARAGDLGVTPPASLREAYEAASTDLATVRDLATRQLATVTALEAADDRITAERDVFSTLGLVGEEPAMALAAATAAFAGGDLATADAGAGSVEALMSAAPDAGRTRLLIAGLAGAGVLAAGATGTWALRRRRLVVVETGPADVAPAGPGTAGEADAAVGPPGLRAPTRPAPESVAAGTDAPDPYATLGAPRPAEAPADEPAEPGRAEGVDT